LLRPLVLRGCRRWPFRRPCRSPEGRPQARRLWL